MTDYTYFSEKVERQLDEIEAMYSEMKSGKLSASKKAEYFKKLDDKSNGLWKRQTSVMKSMKKSIVSIGNSSDRTLAHQAYKEFKKKEEQLRKDFNWLRESSESNELMGNSGDKQSLTQKQIADATVSQANRNAQDAGGLVNTAEQIMGIGQNIAVNLEENNEKLRRINEKTAGIQSQIDRAGKAVQVLKRRVMTDKLFWVFLLLVIVAIAAILIYVAMNPDQSSFAVPKAAVPPNPEEVSKDVQAATSGRRQMFR
jgi:hypothetical protein